MPTRTNEPIMGCDLQELVLGPRAALGTSWHSIYEVTQAYVRLNGKLTVILNVTSNRHNGDAAHRLPATLIVPHTLQAPASSQVT